MKFAKFLPPVKRPRYVVCRNCMWTAGCSYLVCLGAVSFKQDVWGPNFMCFGTDWPKP